MGGSSQGQSPKKQPQFPSASGSPTFPFTSVHLHSPFASGSASPGQGSDDVDDDSSELDDAGSGGGGGGSAAGPPAVQFLLH